MNSEMIVRTTIDNYSEVKDRRPWGGLGPLGPPLIALIPMQRRLPAANAGPQHRDSASVPRTMAERCPRCGRQAVITRDGKICLRSRAGCGSTTPLSPAEEVAVFKRALATASAGRRRGPVRGL